MGGDFNIIRFSYEKNKENSVHHHCDIFNVLIQTCCLMEIHIVRGGFTWSNNRESPTLVKLDRVLMSKNRKDIFPLIKVKKLHRILSDHNPLVIKSEKQCKRSNSSFFFEIG